MTFSKQFEVYLDDFSDRLQRLVVARGVAALGVCALLISLAAVVIAIRSGFPAHIMIAARIVLAVSLAAVAGYFFVILRSRVRGGAAALIESRTPAFSGRVEAYRDTEDTTNPMRELLAEQSLEIARHYSPRRQVRDVEFRTAWSVAAVAALGLLLTAVWGPGNYAFGLRDLWVGWAFPGLLPPQSIEVLPGDDGIRLGGNVRVQASMQGFAPVDAWLHARFGDDDWQQVPMVPADEGFEFTFFSVRQPLQYYVSANNVRSPTYDVRVVDLPVIENLALTFHYPDWTGRPDETRDPGGDIRAIADTEVEVTVTADRPMTPGALIVGDEAIPLEVDGVTGSADITLKEDGQYYVAATVGGERIRLSDDYFISLLDDEAPKISFARPGRDWNASRIEEVTTRITVEDDYRVERLQLQYAVNGGEWQQVDLDAGAGDLEVDHVFFLENLAESGEPLEPGDLIAYFAVAEDREASTRTDMFFIDVQPFDRRYSQSQQSGGGMAGQQGEQQDEISKRQREIIISTWNLIREQTENRRNDDAYVADNSALLARVQQTLKEQVETLAQRTDARQLSATDEQIASFVENLRLAAEAMVPAAERLAAIDLEDALLPEQEALQHLLAAEAVFTDISVSLNNGNQGGGGGQGGGQAGRDLTEMFELEMDLEKNQYESGSVATPQAPPQQMQEAADELAELARRQEQLARNQRQNELPMPEERWQQEMLRREVEQLQQRLEQMAQQNQQSQSGNQQGQAGGQSSSTGAAADSQEQRQLEDLQRRLDSAMRAMNEADEAMRGGLDAEGLQRAMDEAQRQLEGARDSADRARQQAVQARVDELAERADGLHETQAEMEQVLQDAVRENLLNDDNWNRLGSGLSWEEEARIADEKRELLAELQSLQNDMQVAARDLDDNEPRAANELRDSVSELKDQDIEARLALAAAYIEQGEAMYVAASESAVTEALRQLRDDLERVDGMLAGSAAGGQPATRDDLAQALEDTRQLRRDLQASSPEIGEQFRGRAAQLADDVTGLLRQLAQAGSSSQDIDRIRELTAGIRASDFSGNEAILARESRAALSLVEQLELALAQASRNDKGVIRNFATDEVPEQYREIVADYYRRLGQEEDSAPEN